MKNILNIIGIVVLTASLCGCSQYLTDTPSVTFDEQSYMMTAAGGQIVIPVQSTGEGVIHILLACPTILIPYTTIEFVSYLWERLEFSYKSGILSYSERIGCVS